MNSYDFRDRVALVTGAASGIGAAAAAALSAGGAKVATFDRRAAALGDLVLEGDVSDDEAVALAVNRTESELGPVDILVHSAGIGGPFRSGLDLSVEDWRQVMAINADGTFYICRHAIPGMVTRGYGRVVLVASIAGKDGNPLLPAYSASKAAMIALAKSIGRGIADSGVLVNVITPAVIATPLSLGQTEEIQEQMRQAVPMGRMGSPAEAAALISWLASGDCSFSTGAVYDLSGGRSTW